MRGVYRLARIPGQAIRQGRPSEEWAPPADDKKRQREACMNAEDLVFQFLAASVVFAVVMAVVF